MYKKGEKKGEWEEGVLQNHFMPMSRTREESSEKENVIP